MKILLDVFSSGFTSASSTSPFLWLSLDSECLLDSVFFLWLSLDSECLLDSVFFPWLSLDSECLLGSVFFLQRLCRSGVPSRSLRLWYLSPASSSSIGLRKFKRGLLCSSPCISSASLIFFFRSFKD